MRLAGMLFLPMFLANGIAAAAPSAVSPALAADLACYYDFDHPFSADDSREADLGHSRTPLQLLNGGASMRVDDSAYPGAGQSLQTRQVNPHNNGNDDWKAGVFDADGVASLNAFNGATGIAVMGWIKPTGSNPSLNSMTPEPDDLYNAVGLFGLLSGTSEGHLVRALLEIIQVGDEQRLVALGRRDDTGNSLILVADDSWDAILPRNIWTHLTATFDYDNGTMALYRNGEPLSASYSSSDDLWEVAGDPEPDVTSKTDPAGIKIGGSFPQNSAERNPFNGRFDDLMFFSRALGAAEIEAQFKHFATVRAAPQ